MMMSSEACDDHNNDSNTDNNTPASNNNPIKKHDPSFREMEQIMREKKAFYLVVATNDFTFETEAAYVAFPGHLPYFPWSGEERAPSKLLEGILRKLNEAAPHKPALDVDAIITALRAKAAGALAQASSGE